jgi:predicted dehydrogenase
MSATDPVTFGIIGGGWRAEFFLRIAQALPDRFRVGGMVVRDVGKGQALEAAWGVHTYRTPGELLAAMPLAFTVLSVPVAVAPQLLEELAQRQMPTLTETPPARDLAGLQAVYRLVEQGARVQVAEQFLFQPLHAARLALVQSGRLGAISQVQVSVAHGYHGLSILRHMLGVGFAPVTITAREFRSALLAGPTRQGPPSAEQLAPSRQLLAWLDFGDKLGIFDFAGEMYFSWIRSQRLLVRGERGEINNAQVRYLQDFGTPISFDLRRQDAGEEGNLEGYFHRGILGGSEWLYRNPFAPARLTDEEVAIATALAKMADYVNGGPDCYSLAEAAQDQYLALSIEQAITSGAAVRTTPQPWQP